jgi:hypothetical protein
MAFSLSSGSIGTSADPKTVCRVDAAGFENPANGLLFHVSFTSSTRTPALEQGFSPVFSKRCARIDLLPCFSPSTAIPCSLTFVLNSKIAVKLGGGLESGGRTEGSGSAEGGRKHGAARPSHPSASSFSCAPGGLDGGLWLADHTFLLQGRRSSSRFLPAGPEGQCRGSPQTVLCCHKEEAHARRKGLTPQVSRLQLDRTGARTHFATLLASRSRQQRRSKSKLETPAAME